MGEEKEGDEKGERSKGEQIVYCWKRSCATSQSVSIGLFSQLTVADLCSINIIQHQVHMHIHVIHVLYTHIPARLCTCTCALISIPGRFNLDPNRVLDVLMEACECHYEDKDVFLALLRGYPCEQATFVNVLGFKFQSSQVWLQ